MAKVKSQFVCRSCGAVFARWMGKCAECEAWNTVVEEEVVEEGARSNREINYMSGAELQSVIGSLMKEAGPRVPELKQVLLNSYF